MSTEGVESNSDQLSSLVRYESIIIISTNISDVYPTEMLLGDQACQTSQQGKGDDVIMMSLLNDAIIDDVTILASRRVTVNRGRSGYGFTLSGNAPVFIRAVDVHGAAAQAGLRAGDHILELNGLDVRWAECRKATAIATEPLIAAVI